MNGADAAVVLISAALVMLMTSGLAFFYGGMVRVKSALNMLMMSMISLAVVSVLGVLYGCTMAFGDDLGAGLLGGFGHAGFHGITPETLTGKGGIPVLAFAFFQLMFAAITPALMSGALADRVKLTAWTLYIALWVTCVYFPVAHWVWQSGGWLYKLGVLATGGVGGVAQLGEQAVGAFSVMAYSFAVSWLLAKLVDKVIGFRAGEDEEVGGLGMSVYVESAYDFSGAAAGRSSVPAAGAGTHPPTPPTTNRKVDA